MENFRLRVFRAVAKHLNFRLAAEELRLTQPAVTQQIKALEAELDTALFDRAAGRITLTPAGTALLPFAEQLAELPITARQAVAVAAGQTAGTLALAASQTIGQYLLPRILAGFLREHPKVEMTTQSCNTQDALETLVQRRVQLALIEGPALRQDVHVQPFLEDHMVCIVPAQHPWANHDVPLDELRGAPLLTRELGSGSRRIVESALETAGLNTRDLSVRMTFDSTEALLTAVEAGLGIAFVSRWAVRAQLKLGTLRVARIRGLSLARQFSVVRPAGPEASGLAGAFYRFVLEYGTKATER